MEEGQPSNSHDHAPHDDTAGVAEEETIPQGQLTDLLRSGRDSEVASFDNESDSGSLLDVTEDRDTSGVPRISASWLQLLQDCNKVEEANKHYSLRDRDRGNFSGSGWVDLDDSGTYDPSQDVGRVSRRRRPGNRERTVICTPRIGDDNTEEENAEPGQPQARALPYEQGRKAGRQMVVQLTLSSKEGLSKLKQLVQNFRTSERSGETGSRPEGAIRGQRDNRAVRAVKGLSKFTLKRSFSKQFNPRNQKASASRCSFHDRKAKKQKKAHEFDSESTEALLIPEVPGRTIKTITTSFAHPLRLDLACDNEFEWCHFCTEPGLSYGLLGLGSLTIQVIEWDNKPEMGYEEIDDGWCKRNEHRTRMCRICTMERLNVCSCDKHMIRPIAELDPATYDYNAAFCAVFENSMSARADNQFCSKCNGHPKDCNCLEEKRKKAGHWCSICIMPAFFECCTRPISTKYGVETKPTDDIGCGLLLCEACAKRMIGSNMKRQTQRQTPHPRLMNTDTGDVVLRDDTKGKGRAIEVGPFPTELSIDELVVSADQDKYHYPDGLRADVGFITSNGDLLRMLKFNGAANQDDEDGRADEVVEEPRPKKDKGKKRTWGMGGFMDFTI